MIRYFSFLMLIVSIYSCAGKTHFPKIVMKPTQMEEVMIEMFKADALSAEIVRKDSSKKLAVENIRMYQQIFLAHKTTRREFDTSYSFYQKHPELMKLLLDSLHSIQERSRATMFTKPVIVHMDSSKVKS